MKKNNYNQDSKKRNLDRKDSIKQNQEMMSDKDACSYSLGLSQAAVKNKKDEKDAPSREDWEGGASRPANENVPAEKVPNNSPAKDLQRQAESVPKTTYGDYGPPKNLQSLPTQNTHEIDPEDDLGEWIQGGRSRFKTKDQDYRGRRSA